MSNYYPVIRHSGQLIIKKLASALILINLTSLSVMAQISNLTVK
jgi:hypothetical protein